MSSNQNKQSVTTGKKRISFFNFRRSRAPAPPENTAPAKTEPTAAAVDIADTEVTAAVLHSTKEDNAPDKPSTSSARGRIRRFANFFTRSNAANAKKVVQKANTAVDEDVPDPVSETPAEIGQCKMEALKQEDDLSLKEDGAKEEVNATEVDLEEKKANAATIIQAVFRGHNERRKYLKKKEDAVKIEALTRGYVVRKHVSEIKEGSSTVADSENEPSAEEISSNTLVTSP